MADATFEDINDRLKAIVLAVDDPDLPLDEALDLFEEAVGLGMQASSLLEQGIAASNAAASALAEGDEADGTQAASADEAEVASPAEPAGPAGDVADAAPVLVDSDELLD